jgi:hypothetical protein
MKRYLGLNLESLVGGKDLSALFPPQVQKVHIEKIMTNAMQEIEKNLEVWGLLPHFIMVGR